MNNKTHTYRDKGRALFLAAIMVLSMVAMAATFAGPAVADVDAASPGSPEDVTVGQGAVAQDISDINITGASTDDTINVSLDSVVDEGVDISGNTADYSTTNTTGEAAVEAVNTTSNTVSVNVTAVDGGDVSFTLGISNLDTTGANFASGLTYDVTHVGNNTVATDEFDLVGFEVTDLDAPRVTQNDTEITVSATITSHFNENVTQTIQYNATDGDNQGGPVDNEVANESIDLTPGEERNVEFTVNTANISNGGDLPNGGALPREYTHGIFSENDDEQARLTVGVEDDGSIAVTVRGDFDPAVGDVTDVALFTADEWDPDPADRGDPFRVLSTDESGEPNEVEFRNLAIGPDPDNGVEYTALAAYNDSAFESSFETDSLNAQTKTSTGFDIFIDRVVTADQITIEDYDPADSVEVGESIDITTLVQSYEVDDSDLNSLDPFADTTVTVTDIEQTAGEAGTPLQNINEGQSETTDQDGLAVFEDVSVNLTPDDVDDDLVYDITFEATESDDDETVDVTGTVTFEAEPPSGDGVIQGNVEEINEDIELGAQNAEAAEGVNVHAVTLDRLQENTINGTDSEFIEAALDGATQSPTLWVNNTDQAFFRTVVENETSGEIVEVLNVETDYLFKGDVAVSQNLSIEGTGFNAEATNGDGAVSVSVLEPDEELEDDYRYAVQRSADGNFTGAVTVEFNAPNDLTYDGTADRYSDVPAYPTDVTNDDGSYNLQGLYTDNEAGLDYVVIAGDGNADLGFANGQGYDVVNVQQSADSDDPQLNTPLNVQQVDVTADAVDIENVGTIPSADYADEDYESVLDEFDDTADEVRQEIPRDNSTVDVINLGTFVEEDGTLVGANVTVSYDADGDFNGAFLDAAVNGDVVAHDDGEITVNTEDGESVIFLETDDAGLGDDVNVTINAEMDDAAGTDSTDKVFFGVLDQEFLSGSITGVVSDDNDNPVDARIYVSELVDEDAGVTITFEPESVNNLEQFTATVYDGNDNVVETVELTAEEMANFEFQGFNSQLSLAEGEDSFELLADRAADRTTLSPVPAVDADPGVSLALTGVSQTGETGTSVSTAIEVDRTSTASIVIEGVDQANFQVDNLDPEDATIDQGDDLTVTADITNTGDLGGTQNVGLTIFDGDDAVVEETQTLELDAGASETVEFTLEDVQLDAGDYVHRIHTNDDEAEGSLTVEAGDDDGPSLANYTNEDGETTTDLLRQAIDDWRNDDIDTDLLRDVIDNWRN